MPPLSPSCSFSSTSQAVGASAEARSPQQSDEDAVKPSAQAGAFPPLPSQIAGGGGFQFDKSACSRLLEVAAPNCLRCLANGTRTSQGVCFLDPPVRRGERADLRFRFDNKPGRMRYFIGVSRGHFDADAADATLRGAGWSIENLYAGPHREGAPHRSKGLPLFHTGSVVTVVVDLSDPTKAYVSFTIDTGLAHTVQLPGHALESVVVWASLYNRFAQLAFLDT